MSSPQGISRMARERPSICEPWNEFDLFEIFWSYREVKFLMISEKTGTYVSHYVLWIIGFHNSHKTPTVCLP